jgi:hypothetical protein
MNSISSGASTVSSFLAAKEVHLLRLSLPSSVDEVAILSLSQAVFMVSTSKLYQWIGWRVQIYRKSMGLNMV